MNFTHEKCKLCGLVLTTMAVPRRLAKEADIRQYRPIPRVYDWVERDVCVCCDIFTPHAADDPYYGICKHRRDQAVAKGEKATVPA